MSDNLSPDMTLALLQATQNDKAKVAKNIKNAGQIKDLEKIDKTAREFEAMFISEMMRPMFSGLETAAPFGGGKGEEVFRSLLVNEYGNLTMKAGGIGIADQVREEMIRLQGTMYNTGDENNE